MKAIINRNETFGTLNGVITKNEQIRTIVNQHLKEGKAKLLIDTEDTLMYELGALDVISNVQSIQRIIEIPIEELKNEKTEQIGISEQVLNWINEKTHCLNLEEKTTKEVATKFNLTTNAAYRICSILENKGLITKLHPVNSNKFDCSGWIRNKDPR